MHHRYRLEREHTEGFWTVLAGTDTLGDAFCLAQADDYRDLTMRIVDSELGEHAHVPHKEHCGRRHAGYRRHLID